MGIDCVTIFCLGAIVETVQADPRRLGRRQRVANVDWTFPWAWVVVAWTEFVRLCDELDFHNIVISMKASRAPVMLAAYRLMADTLDREGFHYPLHLGVTEAGDGDYGRIKSTAGIATLLAEGLGDTIRVSLTEAPEKEIPVCFSKLLVRVTCQCSAGQIIVAYMVFFSTDKCDFPIYFR